MDYKTALSDNDIEYDEDCVIRLGFLVHDVARWRRTVIDEAFKPLSVTSSQAWLMAYLSRADGLTQSALAKQMNLGKVAVGGLIDRLEKSKMIERRADPTDRRMNNVHVTAKGRNVITSIRKITLLSNQGILEDISIDDVKKTSATLAKLNKNLRAMTKI